MVRDIITIVKGKNAGCGTLGKVVSWQIPCYSKFTGTVLIEQSVLDLYVEGELGAKSRSFGLCLQEQLQYTSLQTAVQQDIVRASLLCVT